MQESVETRSDLYRSELALPRFVVLASEEKAGKVCQLGLLVSRQSFANFNDFLCRPAHGYLITANRTQFKLLRKARLFLLMLKRYLQPFSADN